jgi:hypothetical protein
MSDAPVLIRDVPALMDLDLRENQKICIGTSTWS